MSRNLTGDTAAGSLTCGLSKVRPVEERGGAEEPSDATGGDARRRLPTQATDVLASSRRRLGTAVG